MLVKYVDYWSTYSPVIEWPTTLVFLIALINFLHMRSVDFIMAYPQIDVNTDVYLRSLRVLHDFTIPDLPSFGDSFTKVYHVLQNQYGLKYARKV